MFRRSQSGSGRLVLAKKQRFPRPFISVWEKAGMDIGTKMKAGQKFIYMKTRSELLTWFVYCPNYSGEIDFGNAIGEVFE